MPEKNVRIIYIEWTDSISFGNSVWTKEDTITSGQLPLCKSAGFLIHETEDSMTIAAHIGEGSVSGDICVPKVSIKKRKWLSK